MVITAETIAHKYAIAFYNVYGTTLSENDFQQLNKLGMFFKQQRSFFAYISIPNFSLATKRNFIEKLVQHFELGPQFNTFILLLLQRKRLHLLHFILKHIARQYLKAHSIEQFSVYTSHALSEQEKKQVASFIEHELPAHYHSRVDFFIAPELISGIKIKGDMLLWERSISKLLQNVRRSMLHRIES